MSSQPKRLDIAVDVNLKPDAVLRRYLDLPKFLSLLRTSDIYLQRVDLFPDKLEGVLTPGMRRALDESHSQKRSPYDADKFAAMVRGGIYLSCWSAGAQDNMALWQLYGSSSMGVVVTTTAQRLIDAAIEWSKQERIEIFKVSYIDHLRNPDMVVGRYTDPLRYKHEAYSFEKEVRVVLTRVGTRKPKPPGLHLRVKLDQLVRSVVIAPDASQWFIDLVRDLSNRYELSAPVRRSSLAFVASGKSG
jgi:hypothetical protein